MPVSCWRPGRWDARCWDREALLKGLEHALARHNTSGARLTGPNADFNHANEKEYFEDDWAFHEAILANRGNRYIERAANSRQFHAHRMRQTIRGA